MKRNILSVAIMLSFISATSYAATSGELVTFQSGDYILASEINHNFSTLADKIGAAGTPDNVKVYNVDCSENAESLTTFMNQQGYTDTFMVVNLNGECTWSGFDVNRDAIMFQGGSIIPQANDEGGHGAVTIRMHNVGFSNTYIEGSIHYDNGGGWLDNVGLAGDITVDGGANLALVTVNQGTDLTVKSNSRVWVNGDFAEFGILKVYNNSSLNTGDGFHLKAGYIKLSNGGFIGADNIESISEIDVRRGSHISSAGTINAQELNIRENSTVLTEGVNANSVMVRFGANLNVSNDDDNAEMNVSNFLFAQGGASVNGNKIYATEVGAEQNAAIYVDEIQANNIFAYINGSIGANYIKSLDSVTAERNGVVVVDGILDTPNLTIMNGQVETQGLLFNDIQMWSFGTLSIGEEGGLDEALEHLCRDYEYEGAVYNPMAGIDGLERSTNFPASCEQFFQ